MFEQPIYYILFTYVSTFAGAEPIVYQREFATAAQCHKAEVKVHQQLGTRYSYHTRCNLLGGDSSNSDAIVNFPTANWYQGKPCPKYNSYCKK